MSLLIDLTKSVRGKSIEKVSIDLHKKRVEICNSCENKMITGNCSLCGCFTNDKAKYVNEECPINKW
jgi:hypothetical protein